MDRLADWGRERRGGKEGEGEADNVEEREGEAYVIGGSGEDLESGCRSVGLREALRSRMILKRLE